MKCSMFIHNKFSEEEKMVDARFLKVSKILRNFNLIQLQGIKIQKKTYIQMEIKMMVGTL